MTGAARHGDHPTSRIRASHRDDVGVEGRGGRAGPVCEGGRRDRWSRALGLLIPVLLEDGEILELETVRETIPKSYVSGDQVMATTTYPLAVTAADLDKLQAAAIQMIRLQHSNGSYDWQTNGGVRKTGMAAAACVAEFTKADA